MMKNYVIVLMCLVSSMAMGQSVEIVKDYYPAERLYGLMPNNMVSNSQMMVFAGAEAVWIRGGAPYFFYEPFVTDGTADNFTKIDIVAGEELGSQSRPEKFFTVGDQIYFVGNDDGTNGIYKVTDLAGNYQLVTDAWVPGNQPVNHVLENDKVVFSGRNPADATDNNNYILEWEGDGATLPSVPMGHVGKYNMSPAYGFAAKFSAGSILYVFPAKDPNNETSDYQLCVLYYNFRRGYLTAFTSLNGDPAVNDYPQNFTTIGSEFYFNDNKGQVWKVDLASGSYAASLVSEINDELTVNTNTTKIMGVYEGKLVFYANASGEETTSVFVYDPEASSNALTKLNNGFEIRNPASLVVLDGKMYFEGRYNTIPFDGDLETSPLWCYDGTTLAQLATDLKFVAELHAFNGKVYFSAEDPDGGLGGVSTHKELFVYNPSGTTGILPVLNTSPITVSPNPSNGYVNVSGDAAGMDYRIVNLSGQVIEAGIVDNGTINYEVPAGIYILKVGTTVTKIVVK